MKLIVNPVTVCFDTNFDYVSENFSTQKSNSRGDWWGI